MNDNLQTRLGIPLLLAFLVAGCGTTSSSNSDGAWQQTRATSVPYQTILVVGVAKDSNARRVFEKTVADEITKGGARGIPAYSLKREMGTSEITREIVIAMAEQTGADAVLVTRMVSQDAHGGKSQEEAILHVGPTVRVAEDEDSSMTAVVASNYAVEVVPGSMVIEADAAMETSLYEPATGDKLIYRAVATRHFEMAPGDPVEGVAQKFAQVVAEQLRSDGVIP